MSLIGGRYDYKRGAAVFHASKLKLNIEMGWMHNN